MQIDAASHHVRMRSFEAAYHDVAHELARAGRHDELEVDTLPLSRGRGDELEGRLGVTLVE